MLRRDIRKEMGARLKTLREEKGMSPDELGDRSGLTGFEVLTIENGGKPIRCEDLICLARGLGVPAVRFFE